jgi:hypothetical protein
MEEAEKAKQCDCNTMRCRHLEQIRYEWLSIDHTCNCNGGYRAVRMPVPERPRPDVHGHYLSYRHITSSALETVYRATLPTA